MLPEGQSTPAINIIKNRSEIWSATALVRATHTLHFWIPSCQLSASFIVTFGYHSHHRFNQLYALDIFIAIEHCSTSSFKLTLRYWIFFIFIMPKQRTCLTLEKQREVIRCHGSGKSCRILAEEFGVGKTQIQSIIKRKDDILKDVAGVCLSAKRKHRETGNEPVNELMSVWFNDAKRRKILLAVSDYLY